MKRSVFILTLLAIAAFSYSQDAPKTASTTSTEAGDVGEKPYDEMDYIDLQGLDNGGPQTGEAIVPPAVGTDYVLRVPQTKTETKTETKVVKKPVQKIVKKPVQKVVKRSAGKKEFDWKRFVGSPRQGCYYVQIGVFSDDKTITDLAKQYSVKYPILLSQYGDKSWQFMIGALTFDEYSAVLNRFKRFGHIDAFVKKF